VQANKTAVKTANSSLVEKKEANPKQAKSQDSSSQKAPKSNLKDSQKLSEDKKIIEQKQEADKAKDVWRKTLTEQRVEQNLKALNKKAADASKTESNPSSNNKTALAQPGATHANSLAKVSKPMPKELPAAKEIKKI